jgi:epoxyqueuosine reductase
LPIWRGWTTRHFRALFRGSPIKRIGRDRFVRNVLIAIGNSGDARLATEAERLLGDPSPLVRAMAVWALPAIHARALAQRLWIAGTRPAMTVLGDWVTTSARPA